MAESYILISLFNKLKSDIHEFHYKNAHQKEITLDMKNIMISCNSLEAYIESYNPREEHVVHVSPTYEHAYYSLSAIPRGHVGPTPAMRRYAAAEEKKRMDKVDEVIQMGKNLDANKDTPYFTIQ
jgi:hypothetical protein